jgi:hypothetical protein
LTRLGNGVILPRGLVERQAVNPLSGSWVGDVLAWFRHDCCT